MTPPRRSPTTTGATSRAAKAQKPAPAKAQQAKKTGSKGAGGTARKDAPGAKARRKPPQAEVLAPPPYDAAAVGRVAARINIITVDLVHAHFEREDDGPLPRVPEQETLPEIVFQPSWELAGDGATLGCLFRFAALPAEDPAPYRLIAHFRILYAVSGDGPLDDSDVEAFVFWNGMFNCWPYWREYLSSTTNRAGLPRFVLPVIGVPREPEQEMP